MSTKNSFYRKIFFPIYNELGRRESLSLNSGPRLTKTFFPLYPPWSDADRRLLFHVVRRGHRRSQRSAYWKSMLTPYYGEKKAQLRAPLLDSDAVVVPGSRQSALATGSCWTISHKGAVYAAWRYVALRGAAWRCAALRGVAWRCMVVCGVP